LPTASFVRVISSTPMRFLGRISYGLYLWHYPFTVVLSPKYGFLTWAFVLPLTLTFAIISYFVIERPVLASSKFWRRVSDDRKCDVAVEIGE
jgi:peptidoglycan/LPS O-acetylase OafA/YrhL